MSDDHSKAMLERYQNYKTTISDVDNSILLHQIRFYGRHFEAGYMKEFVFAFETNNEENVARFDSIFENIDTQIIKGINGIDKQYPYHLLSNR